MNKEKRQEKTRQVFIDSAKEIIDERGVDGVSAREISKVSGYSYATLYNYFEDIDSLLTYVAVDYLEESYQIMVKDLDGIDKPKEKIIHTSLTYFEYMFQHPSVFKIIFINDFGKEVEKVAQKLVPKVTVLLRELLNEIPERSMLMNREEMFEMISALIHSNLMFAIYKRSPQSLEQFILKLTSQLNVLLEV